MTLLDVENLSVTYPRRSRRGQDVQAVREVSFSLHAGETLGLVGESGSGKTTIGRAILGLAPVSGGVVRFNGTDLAGWTARQRRRNARDIQVVFQDLYTSLNPAMSVAEILTEPLLTGGVDKTAARATVRNALDSVGMPHDSMNRYAREFSGGQRQRVAIARALVMQPRLIICDEPTSALDLSTQVRVLDLLVDIQERTGIAYLFISHDLGVVRRISHRVAVLRRGALVETGPAAVITSQPTEEYTRRLLLANPVPDPERQRLRREELARLRAG